MTAQETKEFIDCVTHEDCTVRWRDGVYWCNGVTHDPKTGECAIAVWQLDPTNYEDIRDLLDFTGRSTDECMKRFLEDKYWDGRTFYEVAPEMEWIDL